jgi:4-amino-4-deoxy-L-arabinose transferase-like glycosyltransferase
VKRGRGAFYVLSAAAFAFATLTKGPVFMVIPVFIIVSYLVLTKNFNALKDVRAFALSIAVFAAIALPWYVVMYKTHGNLFMDEFFGFHNVTRFMTPEHKTGSQSYYNIPIIFGGFFPWSAFLPVGLWRMFKESRAATKTHNPGSFILLWLAVIFVFFSISSTKLPTYIFPCFMSLALITGRFWDSFLADAKENGIFRSMSISYYMLMLAIAATAIGGYIFLKLDSPEMLTGAVISGLFLILGMTISLIAFIYKKFTAAFAFIAYSISLVLIPAASLILPDVEGYETSKPVARIISANCKKGDIIASEKDYRPGVAFYTGAIPAFLSNSSNLDEYRRAGKTVWAVLKRRNIVDQNYNIVCSFGKKCLVTNSKEALK